MAAEACIVTFPTVHAAIQAERAAKEEGMVVQMIPVPREVSSDCNVGMEASIADVATLRSVLASRGIECDFVRWTRR